ncbi:MAG: DUF1795 domain-containing protein [Phycisphaerae bacterium]|nr:DUF1795 domain-containing protein [Phycisphaerae bacterium]
MSARPPGRGRYALAVLLGIGSWAHAEDALSPARVLDAMEAGAKTVGSFSCTFVVKFEGRARSMPDGSMEFRDPADQGPEPKPRGTMEVTVDGERYRRVERAVRPRDRIETLITAWDGTRGTGYQPGSQKGTIIGPKEAFFPDGDIHDPRTFTEYVTPFESRYRFLRDLERQGRLAVQNTVLDDRPMILVEGFSEDIRRGYRLWVDPTRNHLPVKIERVLELQAGGQRLLRHRHSALYEEVAPGLWFPVKGTLEHVECGDAANVGKVRSRLLMEVDRASIVIAPKVAPETFTIEFPAGTRVLDAREGRNELFMSSSSSGDIASPGEGPSVGRLFEQDGGFSFDPPDTWLIRDWPGMKYRIAVSPVQNGFSRNINVVDEQYEGSINAYVDAGIKTLAKIFPKFTVLDRRPFMPSRGSEGVVLVNQNEQAGKLLRQRVYFFAKANRKYVVTCSSLAEDGDQFDDLFDASMKTFQLH